MDCDGADTPELTILMPCLDEAETIGGCVTETLVGSTLLSVGTEML